MPRKVLLDTCALVWLVAGDKRLSDRAREAIDAAPVAMVSAISAWEISLLVVRGGLQLPMAAAAWFSRALEVHHLVLAELSVEVLMGANALPWHHRDPADRFIIATAKAQDLDVITVDARFASYGVTVLC